MVDKKNIKEKAWILYSVLRGQIGYYDLYGSAVKLLFIKYISTYPDKLPITSMEDYRKLTEFKRTIDAARNGGTLLTAENLRDVLSVADDCVCDSNVRLVDAVDGMQYFFEPNQQKAILDALDGFAMEDDAASMKELFAALIEQSGNDVKLTGENTTNPSLRKLAERLLAIFEDDDVLNSYCGFSTLLLDTGLMNSYAGYDVNPNNVQVSVMMAMMLGLKNYSIKNDDYVTVESEAKYTKAFVDGPLGMKKQVLDSDKKYGSIRDIEAIGMYKTVEFLKEGGKAAFAVPGKILFSAAKGMAELRRHFVELGLKSVIALPPLWNGTSIPTNLVLFEKGYTGDVAMVNARNFGITIRRTTELSDVDIGLITGMSEMRLGGDDCSYINRNDTRLLESWVPERYMQIVDIATPARDIKEIDRELADLYDELKNL